MDFDPTPYMQNPVVNTIGLISAVILMLKGTLVLITEFVRMIPPLIEAIRECWRKARNGNGTH